MTHEGRMTRGKAYAEAGKFLDNSETIDYLANKVEEPVEEPVVKPKKEKKNASKQR